MLLFSERRREWWERLGKQNPRNLCEQYFRTILEDFQKFTTSR